MSVEFVLLCIFTFSFLLTVISSYDPRLVKATVPQEHCSDWVQFDKAGNLKFFVLYKKTKHDKLLIQDPEPEDISEYLDALGGKEEEEEEANV